MGIAINGLFDKIGIGVDIEEISRFRELDFDQNRDFYEKVFHEDEIKYCLGKTDMYEHFAVRFCAKEAFIKAMKRMLDYKAIEVRMNDNAPFIFWNDKEHLLSVSHDKSQAIAMVIIEHVKAK
ncbi:MAG: 4'-phosphopantetheinyl transferase superfamily protein [Nanoarchaeota archaeon]